LDSKEYQTILAPALIFHEPLLMFADKTILPLYVPVVSIVVEKYKCSVEPLISFVEVSV
jgi:hypothetical protein